MYVYYLHFYFYLIPSLNQGITSLQNSYPLSLHPLYTIAWYLYKEYLHDIAFYIVATIPCFIFVPMCINKDYELKLVCYKNTSLLP